MSQQEICQIVHKHRDVSMSKIANWWEARQATPQGESSLPFHHRAVRIGVEGCYEVGLAYE